VEFYADVYPGAERPYFDITSWIPSARISRMLESEIEVGLQPLVRVYITGKGGLGVGLFRKAG
jgi:hypothetical protein